jgi:hypothetical protein
MTDHTSAPPFRPWIVGDVHPTRRQFVLAAAALTGLGRLTPAAEPKKRPRVAAVYTVFSHRTHAHDILENFLEPYYFNGKLTDAAIHSRAEGKALATPQLEFAYKPVDFRALRETGASWKIITEEKPELPGINPNGGNKP